MAYHWRWGVFFDPVPSGGATYLGWMLVGLRTTVQLSFTAWLIALVVGSLMGVLRTVPSRWLRGIAAVYVEVFRNVPLLVQLFIWYFVVPELLPVSIGTAVKELHPFGPDPTFAPRAVR
jgi:glutamate/aspartate transport system permease protein